MRQISITEWRKNFEKYVDEASAGVMFVITRYGKPHCCLVPLDQADQNELERTAPDGPVLTR